MYKEKNSFFSIHEHLTDSCISLGDFCNKSVIYNFLFQMFNVYIKRAAEIYGVTYTRPIYEKAIEVLPDEQARYVLILVSSVVLTACKNM